MFRLFFAIHAMAMAVLMGIGITAVLTMNLPGWKPVALAALAGFVVSVPAAWVVTKKIQTAAR